jgi:hypothetical protein
MKLRGVSDPPERVRCIPDLVVRIRDCSDYEIRLLVEYINFGESGFVLVPPGQTFSNALIQQSLFNLPTLTKDLDVDKILSSASKK